MSSETPSNDPPCGVRNESIARVRRTSTAGWTKPGRYQATTRNPARVQLVDEEPELLRVDDVDGAAVVRRLDVDGAHAAGSDPSRRRPGAAVGGRVVDVDPRAEPREHLRVGPGRCLRAERGKHESGENCGERDAAHAPECTSQV